MKKVVVLALSLILLAGCSAHRTSNAEKLRQASQSSEPKLVHKKSSARRETKTVSYHQLSKVDRDKVFFRFKATQDSSEATSGTNGQGDSPCFVDMEVTNKTEKKVTLDTSKILLYESQQDPEKPAVSKTLTIAPGKSKMVERIFDNMNPQYFVGGGTFIYLSNEFPLAYTYMAFKGNGSTSDSLKDKEVIAKNRDADEVTSVGNGASTNEDDSAEDNSSSEIGVNNSSVIKVTPASQFSSFTFTNISDKQITISPDSLLLRIDNQAEFFSVPQDIVDAGDVTIQPGKSHVYQYLFGYEGMQASSLSIAFDTGGNIIWSWDGQTSN
ncbi:hypothetical protein [Lacticaseibacillus parakribbianus]|uniref:hypothetical protein n=1 Tax=Lacticaseibacillus parakribbianus TaxID=2970927 RepID=UPI0021CB55D6|nr:hypothetical protein [Lacticaseibacillus parakribbianus]